jgi:hypothetical protein
MTSDDLLEGTARYQVREASPPPVLSSENYMQTERPPLPLGIARESNENRPPSRRIEWMDDASARTVPPPISDHSLYSENPSLRRLPSFQPDNNLSPPRRASSPPNPVFTVTTDCDDHSGDEEEESSAAILADRLRREHLHPNYGSSDGDTEDGDLDHWVNSALALGVNPSRRRSRRRANPSRIEIAEPLSDENQDEEEGEPSVDVLTPHARFFIEMQKSQISIKFDPPV